MSADPLFETALQWAAADPDPETQAQVRELVARGERFELAERFGAALQFGTAGLRGLLGGGPNRMNRAVVRRATFGVAQVLKAEVPDAARRGVVVARDGRHMSRELAEDVAGVLAAAGIPAWVFPDVCPTPVAVFSATRLGAAAAVVVTASHNPPAYNGYKLYWSNGAQIIPPIDERVAQAIEAAPAAAAVPLLAEVPARLQGLWRQVPSSFEDAYRDGVVALAPTRSPAAAAELSIVYTAMHGVGARWTLGALAAAGFSRVRSVPEQEAVDPDFPTVRFPNPEEKGALKLPATLAESVGADLVLANDPDADRLAVMARTTSGALVPLSGNEVGILLGHYLLSHAKGPSAVVTTIVSSGQLRAVARALGAEYAETLTGFKWIANRAMELEAKGLRFVFGFEEALGYTVGGLVRDKDGIGAAVVVAEMAAWCRARGTTLFGYLEELRRAFGLSVGRQYSATLLGTAGASVIGQVMEAFRARPPAAIGPWAVEAVNDYLRRERTEGGAVAALSLPSAEVLAYELAGGGRVTLRPSGTEPKLKVYFELSEALAKDEPLEEARRRCDARLQALEGAFLEEARARGLP